MLDDFNNDVVGSSNSSSAEETTDIFEKVNPSTSEDNISSVSEDSINQEQAGFKVASTNLPEKTSVWTKIKNVLFYEIKVELTPYQQKVEDEINEFLHQEVTWQSFKNFLFKEVPITYKGKRVF